MKRIKITHRGGPMVPSGSATPVTIEYAADRDRTILLVASTGAQVAPSAIPVRAGPGAWHGELVLRAERDLFVRVWAELGLEEDSFDVEVKV